MTATYFGAVTSAMLAALKPAQAGWVLQTVLRWKETGEEPEEADIPPALRVVWLGVREESLAIKQKREREGSGWSSEAKSRAGKASAVSRRKQKAPKEANEQKIEQNEQKFEQEIEHNEQEIEHNEQEIEHNEQEIEHNEQEIEHNEQEIEHNEQEIEHNEQNEQEIEHNEQEIEHNEQNEQEIEHNEQEIEHNEQNEHNFLARARRSEVKRSEVIKSEEEDKEEVSTSTFEPSTSVFSPKKISSTSTSTSDASLGLQPGMSLERAREEDFAAWAWAITDPVDAALAATGEGPDKKRLYGARLKDLGRRGFLSIVTAFKAERDAGEEPVNPGAALNKRLTAAAAAKLREWENAR